MGLIWIVLGCTRQHVEDRRSTCVQASLTRCWAMGRKRDAGIAVLVKEMG